MKKIVVNTKSEIKATGLPKGSLISYDDAPEFMQKRYDDVHRPLDPETAERLRKENEQYAAQAKTMRDNVAAGRMPF